MKKYLLIPALVLLVGAVILDGQSRGNPSNLRINVDANGYIVAAVGAQTLPITRVTFSNANLAVDASGNLQVATTGGTAITCTNQVLRAIATDGSGTCITVTSAYVDSSIVTAAGTNTLTAANVIRVDNAAGIIPLTVYRNAVGYPVDVHAFKIDTETAATAIVTRQEPGKFVECANAWQTVALASQKGCFSLSVVMDPGASTPVLGSMCWNWEPLGVFGSCLMQLTSAGKVTSQGAAGFASLDLSGSAIAGAGAGNIVLRNNSTSGFYWASRVTLTTPGADLFNATNEAGSSGQQLNAGVPALGTCTNGSLTSGSHNFAGEVTGNTSGSCIINFGTDWTNTPFCVAMSGSSTTHPRISANSAASITVTGTVSGETFRYICEGRIGT